jgi:transposase
VDELAELRAENARLRVENARIPELVAQIAALVETVATLSKIVYGDSSERTKKNPVDETNDAKTEHDSDPVGTERAKRGHKNGETGHGRRDYDDLETEEIIHDLDDADKCCKECGTPFEPFGDESCEQIDWIVKLVRIVHKRRRYRHNCKCNGPGMVIAPVVPKPIGKGRFTSGFLSRLIIEKYCFGTPLNRIVANLALSGAELSTGTLTGSLQSCSILLEPLAKAIAVHNAKAAHLHIDETSWKVYEQVAGKKGNRWWLWVFVGPDSRTPDTVSKKLL